MSSHEPTPASNRLRARRRALRGRHPTSDVVEHVKTTVVGGLVFLAPVAVLIYLAVKVFGVLRRVAEPLVARWSLHGLLGIVAVDLAVAFVLLIACFFAGLLARRSFANSFVRKAEAGVLWRLPGYGFVKGLTEGLDKHAAAAMRPVLIRFDDAAQLAFEVERLADDRRVVYLPGSPDPRAGSVMVMTGERVEPVPMSFLAAMTSLRALGRGLGKSLGPPGT
jgi:uncharacterized membrane protein